jgi:hypothetical protein
MAFGTKGQWTWKQFSICFIICLGQIAFGYPASVIGVTLTKPSFLAYMNVIDAEGNFTDHGNALIGAMSGVFQVRTFSRQKIKVSLT